MNTGEIIDKLAKERGMNLHQVAVKADVPYNTLYAIVKRNSARVSTDIINRVALALEVPDYMLFSRNDENKTVHIEKGPEQTRIEHRLKALSQVALISYLFTVALPDAYSDLPDEGKKRIVQKRRMLLASAKILCTKNSLTEDDVSDYHTEKLLNEYQQSILKTGLEISKDYERWLQHISRFMYRYATLNAAGRKELEKRLDEVERLEEYEDQILTAEVKKAIENTIK